MTTNQPSSPLLKSLESLELAGITFMRGYIRFLFDGPILDTYTLPHVTTNKEIFRPDMSGFRDALCELIGKRVASTHEEPAIRIAIQFEGGSSIEVSLRDEDRVCAEAAMLRSDSGVRWNTW